MVNLNLGGHKYYTNRAQSCTMPCILCCGASHVHIVGTGLSHQLVGDAISHERCMQNIPTQVNAA